jgi:hypothetical protein
MLPRPDGRDSHRETTTMIMYVAFAAILTLLLTIHYRVQLHYIPIWDAEEHPQLVS